jgi:uncharacterized lipoprotein YmbA
MMRYPLLFVLAAVGTAVALGGCFGARSNPSEFYVLTTVTEPEPVEPSSEALDVSVGLGPIELPEYLDRPQLVTRLGENEVAVSEYERWAGSLEGDVREALEVNLAVLLQTHDIHLHPWYATTHIDYHVSIGVVRFERTATGSAELVAGWEIKNGDSGERYDNRVLRISQLADTATTAGAVAALSRALGEFSEELAAAIRAVHARVANE